MPVVTDEDATRNLLNNTHAVYMIMLLTSEDVTEEMVEGWTIEQRGLAVDWAGAVHLEASDHDDVVVPPKPDFLPGPRKAEMRTDLVPGTTTPFQIPNEEAPERAAYALSLGERAFTDPRSAASNMIDEGDQAPILPEPPANAEAPAVMKQGLEYDQPDSDGYVPDLDMIGTLWRHYRTGNTYVITGFKMNCTNDRWAYEYTETGRWGTTVPPYVRDVDNFHSYVDDGVTRFAPA